MKKLLPSLLITTMILNASTIFANDSSSTPCNTSCKNVNKTFLMPRSHGVNLALHVTGGMYGFTYETENLKYGGNLQSIWFYEASTDDNKLGRYFSPTKKDKSTCDQSSTSCNTMCKACPTGNTFTFGGAKGTNFQSTIPHDLNYRNFIHYPLEAIDESDNSGSTPEKAAAMNLTMNRKAYGTTLNYYQDLKKMIDGMFLQVNLPLVHVEHNIQSCTQGFDVTFDVTDFRDNVTGAILRKTLEDYFSGNDVHLTIGSVFCPMPLPVLQERLKFDLIPPCRGACDALPYSANERASRTGVADIDIMLGYRLLKKDTHNVSVNFGFTIPTGNKAHELRLWEPIVGNGGHWAVGAGFYGDMQVHNKDGHNLALLTALHYRYLLRADECRKLGLCGQEWGHFRLLGKNGHSKLVPAANILVQNVAITPGSQVDWVVQLNYNKETGFGLDLGYELYYRDREDIKKPCDILPIDTYAYVIKSFDNRDGLPFSAEFIEHDADGNQNWLSDKDVDASVAETPAQLSHKIFGSLSWRFTEWEIPGLIGAGAHYECGDGNQTLSTWGLNVKMAIAF